MGYNSVLVVLNDRLHEIERDPEFGKKVANAIRHFSRSDPERMPYITGQTQVINVEHADTAQVIRVGANCGRVIGVGYWQRTDEELVASLYHEIKKRAREAKLMAAVKAIEP
jgi:hypothetical protein